MDNQNPYISEEEQVMPWPKEKGQTKMNKILLRKLKIVHLLKKPIKKPGWTHMLRKGKQLLLH